MPEQWVGRIWTRTGCDSSGKCATGDCEGKLECGGTDGKPPATLAEFSLGIGERDFYDISIVDGFNIGMTIWTGGLTKGNCSTITCDHIRCPEELQLKGAGGDILGRKSACLAFGNEEYCCKGPFSSPAKCKPSNYSPCSKKLAHRLTHMPSTIPLLSSHATPRSILFGFAS